MNDRLDQSIVKIIYIYIYTGDRCLAVTDQCALNPCAIPKVCKSEGTSYTCVCPTGLSGANCDQMTVPTKEPVRCRDGSCPGKPSKMKNMPKFVL